MAERSASAILTAMSAMEERVDGEEPAGMRPEGPTGRELLREAAIQAEYATGRREDTEEQARRGVIRRIGTIVVGFVVLFSGLVMLVLPGPGILGVIAGLAILAQELAWAERTLTYVKKRARVEELQQQPRWVQAAMWTFTAGVAAASLSYFFILR